MKNDPVLLIPWNIVRPLLRDNTVHAWNIISPGFTKEKRIFELKNAFTVYVLAYDIRRGLAAADLNDAMRMVHDQVEDSLSELPPTLYGFYDTLGTLGCVVEIDVTSVFEDYWDLSRDAIWVEKDVKLFKRLAISQSNGMLSCKKDLEGVLSFLVELQDSYYN